MSRGWYFCVYGRIMRTRGGRRRSGRSYTYNVLGRKYKAKGENRASNYCSVDLHDDYNTAIYAAVYSRLCTIICVYGYYIHGDRVTLIRRQPGGPTASTSRRRALRVLRRAGTCSIRHASLRRRRPAARTGYGAPETTIIYL